MDRWNPKLRQLKNEYSIAIEQGRRNVNELLKDRKLTDDQYIAMIPDYLMHLYRYSPKKHNDFINKFKKYSPNAKKRKFPTLKEAMDAGLVPITQDVALLYDKWIDINYSVVAAKSMISDIYELETPEGTPVLLRPKDAPSDWGTTKHPFFNPEGGEMAYHPMIKPVVRHIDVKAPWAISRAYDNLSAIAKTTVLSFSFFHYFPLIESYAGELGIPKAFKGGLGATKGAASKYGNLLTLGKLPEVKGSLRSISDGILKYHSDEIYDRGLVIDEIIDTEANLAMRNLLKFESYLRSNISKKTLGKGSKLLRTYFEKNSQALWGEFHTPMKVITYFEQSRKAMAEFPDLDPRLVQETVASLVNDSFGGIEWVNTAMRDPLFQKALRRGFLAPDWTMAAIRNYWTAAGIPTKITKLLNEQLGTYTGMKDEGSATRNYLLKSSKIHDFGQKQKRKYFGRIMATLGITTLGVQSAINLWNKALGEELDDEHEFFFWNNESSKKFRVDVTPIVRAYRNKLGGLHPGDKRRYYAAFGKQVSEVPRWIFDFENIASSKTNPLLATFYEQLTGVTVGDNRYVLDFAKAYDFEGMNWFTVRKRIGHIAEGFTPFSFSGNNFLLAFPMAQGLTYSKLKTEYHRLMVATVDPKWQDHMENKVYGYKREDGTVITKQDFFKRYHNLMEDGILNGVDYEKAYDNAYREVRAYYEGRFIESMEGLIPNEKDAERYLGALKQLQGKWGTIQDNIYRNFDISEERKQRMIHKWLDIMTKVEKE